MDYPSPEMPGKIWITIIMNHGFHKSLPSIGMFSFILDGKGSACKIERILQYETRIYTDFIRLFKFFKKNTKNGLLSCHSCVIRTECSTHHRFRLISVLHRFWGLKAARNNDAENSALITGINYILQYSNRKQLLYIVKLYFGSNQCRLGKQKRLL